MKRIALLGSTGSIGRQTLEVIAALGPEYAVAALTANQNDRLLEEQIRRFKPLMAVLSDEEAAKRLSERVRDLSCRIEKGREGQLAAASLPAVDMVVLAQVGFSGFEPLLAALRAKKTVALANKESLVTGGEILERLGLLDRERIIPVDSEHSAIFQCLGPSPLKEVSRIFLTASGGPFFGYSRSRLEKVKAEDALKHPNWQMGAKITIDSATMMNKGLEVIEARWLFGLDLDQIEVVVHPQSIVHSMVEYIDGSILAQLGLPDMRLPIQYALTYPERRAGPLKQYSPFGAKLEFARPDWENFPCLELAFRSAQAGGTMPAVLNAANEVAVQFFLDGKISFTAIPELIEKVMAEHGTVEKPGLEALLGADREARRRAQQLCKEF